MSSRPHVYENDTPSPWSPPLSWGPDLGQFRTLYGEAVTSAYHARFNPSEKLYRRFISS